MKKKSTYHLDSFVKEIQDDIVKFAEEYRKKHAKDPENYPLEFNENNSGLWLEFFLMFCNEGEV